MPGQTFSSAWKSRSQGYFQMTGRFKDDPNWFQAGDVPDGLCDVFMVIGELPSFLGIADRHVQGILGDIHADTDYFFCH